MDGQIKRPQWIVWSTLALCALFGLVAAEARAAELAPLPAVGLSTEWVAPSWRWRRVPVNASGQGQGLLAVAVEAGASRSGRVAIGDLAGVSLRDGLGDGNGAFRFAARVAGVTDLAFAPDGSLWIASFAGLFRLSSEGRLADRSPAPGARSRTVHRVVVGASGRVAVGTEAGAWTSNDGRSWRRLAAGVPMGSVRALALDDGASVLWLVVGAEVWRFRLDESASGAERMRIPGAPTGVAPRDLVLGLSGTEVVVVYPRLLAVRDESRSAPGAFRIVRPSLPPGAVANRLTAAAGRLWLATDQGLLRSRAVAGPWRRSEAPAGRASIRSLAATNARDGVLAAGSAGLLHGAPVLRAEATDLGPIVTTIAPVTADPGIRAVQAASLRYLDLGPKRMRALAVGLDRRGWLPTVSLRISAARERSWGRDYDETFVSGDTRRLYDHEKDKNLDLEASIIMSWAFPDLAFDESAIDISREHRLIVSLRDNVLDEVNQIYFERRGLLERLRDPELPHDADARVLTLRAAELAAGLDAWTGGWFSRRGDHPSTHPPPGPGPNDEERP